VSVADSGKGDQSDQTQHVESKAQPTWREALAAHRQQQQEVFGMTVSVDDVFSNPRMERSTANANLAKQEAGHEHQIGLSHPYNRALDVETPSPEPRSTRFARMNTLKSYPSIASVLVAAEYFDCATRNDETPSSNGSSYQDSVHDGEELAISSDK
jgi:hypothetical protein